MSGYRRMFTALETTSTATTSEIASSAIIMSFAQGLIAETVRRAERRGGSEREVEVVHEFRIPVRPHVLDVGHFRKDEGGLTARAARAGRRAAPVEIQYHRPKAMTLLSQIAPPLASRTLASVLNFTAPMIPATRRTAAGGVHGGDQADQRPCHHAEPSGVAVDAAGIADDQYGQQHDDDNDEGPAGISAPELGRQGGAEASGGQHGQRHRPAALAGPA